MENGGKRITAVKLYSCGYCINNLKHVFRKQKKEKRKFPALVVRLQHETLGTVLYDTGYSELIYKNHIISFLYNALNRSYVEEKDRITEKLRKDNIHPDSVKTVILSHAHPDHMGGLRLLRGYELLGTKEVLSALKRGNPFQLVFRNMRPEDEIVCKEVSPSREPSVLDGYFEKTYDVLGDGSVIGVELNGHANGQMGLYLLEYQLLFAADACWGEDLLEKVNDMRFPARLIQNDYAAYVKTVQALRRFHAEHPEVTILFSHDRLEEKTYE